MDESTLVSHGQALNIRLSAVRHTPHIENDPRAPPQAYDKSAEKQLVVFCDYPEVVPNYPEVVKALPLAWIGTRPEPYEPRKNSHRWDTWWPRGGRRRLTGRVFWALIVIVVAAIVTAGVGLGLNLGMRHTGSDTSTPAASSTMAPAVPEVTSTSTPVTLLTMVLVVLEETGTSTPAALSTTSPAVPVASSTASTPNCQQGILYCGWDLIESHNYSAMYLEDTGSQDVYNDLYLCADSNGLTFNETCGGSHHCRPPRYNVTGCSEITNQSYCGAV